MITHFIEVTGTLNWGKFLLMRFDSEWSYRSQVNVIAPRSRLGA